MLPLILAAVLAQEPVLLEHATHHETTLGPEDPVLDGFGPYRVFRYELEAEDSTVFVYAQSERADLVLAARFESDDEPAVPSSGTGTVSGKKRDPVYYRDDDSGGGTTPLLILPREGGGALRIRVAAKSSGTGIPIKIHCFEARETDATRAALEESAPVVTAIEAAVEQKDFTRARQLASELIEQLANTEGARLSRGIGVLLWNLGVEAHRASSLPAASRAWSAALEFCQTTLPPDHDEVLVAMQNLAAALLALGEVQRSYELKTRVLEARERLLPADHPERLRAQMSVAAALFAMRDFNGARRQYEEVLAIQSRSLPDDDLNRIATVQNLAGVLTKLGDFQAARPLAEEAHAVQARRLPEDHSQLLNARQNLGALRFEMGDVDGARELFETVLAVRSRTLPPDHPLLLSAQGNLAAILLHAAQYDKAREVLEDIHASEQRRLPPEHPDLLRTKGRLALAYAKLGDPERAAELSLAVYEIQRERLPPNHPELVNTMQSLIARRQESGDWLGALEFARQVLQAREAVLTNGHPDLTAARENLVLALAKAGKDEEARRLLHTNLEGRLAYADQLRTSSPRLARDIASSQLRLFGWLEYWCRSLTTPESEPFEPALFGVLESFRSLTLGSEEIAWASARNPELADLRRQLMSIGSELSSVTLNAPKDRSLVEAWRRQLFELSSERDRLQRKVLLALAERGLAFERPTAARVAQGLPEGAALVSYYRYTDYPGRDPKTDDWIRVDSLLAFVVSPGGSVELVKLGAAEPIGEALSRWRESLGRPITSRGLRGVEGRRDAVSERESGAALHRLVLQPVLARLGETRTLHLILDDFLHLLPFEALPEGDRRVGDRLRIRYEPTVLRLLRNPRPVEGEARLVAFGGIDYETGPESTFDNPWLEPTAPPIAATRGGERTAFTAGFPPLQGTAREVDFLSGVFRERFDAEPLVLKGAAASKEALFREAGRARWLHVATHGWFAPEVIPSDESASESESDVPTDSQITRSRRTVQGFAPQVLCGLALAGANRGVDENGDVPGIATAEELATLDLSNCELAVLSACETNVGLRRAGQGIQSLQTALHAAGARTAVTSLWKVDDAATQRLFEVFYVSLWEKGLGKADALDRARRTLREEGRPVRDWAGWVLSGDPD